MLHKLYGHATALRKVTCDFSRHTDLTMPRKSCFLIIFPISYTEKDPNGAVFSPLVAVRLTAGISEMHEKSQHKFGNCVRITIDFGRAFWYTINVKKS